MAHVEAVLDFGDDNDIENNVADEIYPSALALRQSLEYHLAEGNRLQAVRPHRAMLVLVAIFYNKKKY